MLEDLSAHVLDIAENSVMAEAAEIKITVAEDRADNKLIFSVEDDGRGMSEDFVLKVTDPFTTTRTTRRVGMGLPFLKQSAELCGGGLEINSRKGAGTRITAVFAYDSIDRPPLGDIPATLMTLVMGSPRVHWVYRHITPQGEFVLDTDEIIGALDGDRELLRSYEVGLWLRDHIRDGLEEIYWDDGKGQAQSK